MFDFKKDVFIEFYVFWCGYCKVFELIYKKLGKKFKDDLNLVIVKMDVIVNDILFGYKVEGYFIIFFVLVNDKKNLVKYEGERNLDDLVKFINEKVIVFLK